MVSMLAATFPDHLLANYDLLACGGSVIVIYQGATLKIYTLAGQLVKSIPMTLVQSVSVHRRLILIQTSTKLLLFDEKGTVLISRDVPQMIQVAWYALADRILVLTPSALLVLNKQLETLSTVNFNDRPHLKVTSFAVTHHVAWPSLWLLWEDGEITVQCPFLLFPLRPLPQLEHLTRLALDSADEDEEVVKLISFLNRHGRTLDGIVERSPHSLLKNLPWCPTLFSQETDLEYERLWPCGGYLVAQRGAHLNVFLPRNTPCFLEPQDQHLELVRHFEGVCIVSVHEGGDLILSQGGCLHFDNLQFGPLKDAFKMAPLEWPARLELALSALPPAAVQLAKSEPIEVRPFKPIPISTQLSGCSFPSDLTSIPPCLSFIQAIDHLKREAIPPLIQAGEQIRQRSLALEEAIRMQTSWSKQLDQVTSLLTERSQQLLTVHAQVMQREVRLLHRWQRVSLHFSREMDTLSSQLSQIQERISLEVEPVDEARILLALIQLQSDVINPAKQ